jgi:hypothetical protein
VLVGRVRMYGIKNHKQSMHLVFIQRFCRRVINMWAIQVKPFHLNVWVLQPIVSQRQQWFEHVQPIKRDVKIR